MYDTNWPPSSGRNVKPNGWERNLYGFAVRGNKAIAVGEWSVLTYVPELSENGLWSDMLTPRGETFHYTWNDVTFSDDNTAVAVGRNGIITKFYPQ